MNSDKKIDFKTEWPKVTQGFRQILEAPETGIGINMKDWMNYYNSVFQLAIAQYEERMFVEIARIFQQFVRDQSKKIFAKEGGESMLKEYLRLFGDFTKTALSVSRICRYLERYWIPNSVGKTPEGVEVRQIYPLALVMWRQHCFDPIKEKLIPSLLDLLDQDRSGNKIDKSLVRNLVQTYIEFDTVRQNEGLHFYEKEFEAQYIMRLKTFYLQESQEFIEANGVSLYLQKAEERIEEEKKNSEYLGRYLSSSEPKIKRAIDEVLIEKHYEKIQMDFWRMLKEDKLDDMKRLYNLLARIQDGLKTPGESFQSFLVEMGSKIVAEQKEKDVKEALMNAVNFCKTIMNFYTKYEKLVETCFSKNPLFKTSMDKAFRDIMNQDSGRFNIPRLLNYYLDNIIKGKEKDVTNEDEIEKVITTIVNLFTYLKDKDEFFEYFRKSLCKRLLSKTKLYNENAESLFLSKLKGQSGDAAVRKLQGMFHDVQEESIQQVKREFESFNDGSPKVGGVDLEVQVLNESHWPISGTHKFPLLLGNELLKCQQQFQKFYDQTKERRRLQWMYNYGTVTLASRFTNSKAPIQLVLTPIQASILLCFNGSEKLSFEEVQNILWPQQESSSNDMSLEEILKYAIQPLVYFKYKVLGKENDGDPKLETISKTDVFYLRDKIPAKKVPRKIQFPPGSAKKEEADANQDKLLVMKQREYEIDAAMVRVMKARNRLEWNTLSVEVVNILHDRFIPEPKTLKKRLESLIERQFMRRDENDPKIIIYISQQKK